MSKLISLHGHKLQKLGKTLSEASENADEEHSYITDELIDFAIEKGETTLASAVKTIFALAKQMDKYEYELAKLKLVILQAARRDGVDV